MCSALITKKKPDINYKCNFYFNIFGVFIGCKFGENLYGNLHIIYMYKFKVNFYVKFTSNLLAIFCTICIQFRWTKHIDLLAFG